MLTTVLAAADAPIPGAFLIAPAAAIAALGTALVFYRSVLARPEGTPEMIAIAGAVREGAVAYLKRQSAVVAAVFGVLALVLAGQALIGLGSIWSAVGVVLAGFLSAMSGWFGMKTATSASHRTAAAARQSLNDGLTVAFRSGAVMGLTVVGLALLDVSFWFFFFKTFGPRVGVEGGLVEILTILVSYKMGASLQALFARVGGGIFTKAADVGADLVGKVEAGIPEDDPRNPATIADNVGDNVGDVAGMGADLYESYYSAIISTMVIGAGAAAALGLNAGSTATLAMLLVAAPLALAGLGILASIAGIFTVRAREGAGFSDLLKALRLGVWTASALIAAGSLGMLYLLLGGLRFDENPGNPVFTWWGLWLAIVSGLVSGLIIAQATEYSTSYEHPPTRRIARQGLTGPATVIIAGIAEGMKSTWAALLTVVAATLAAFLFAGGSQSFLMGLYGVAIAAVGMLSTLGITLATDAYGPIADNAGGNAEMSGQPPEVRRRTDMLDSLGNTTAAVGKGFAIGSAALTALALLVAFVQVVQVQQTRLAREFHAGFDYASAAMKGGVSRTAPHAIYQGHGRFAIVLPAGGGPPLVDGGIIDMTRLEEHVLEALRPGMVLP
ncbi:MAG: sodium/proton-translocating pyrophosphatase, partial [Phycisphaerales bacterium]|nr:sodium/proton-translocating pyrophosphatase [Phycisphaerales bacterium]